jgi:dCMP deaminase
MIGAALYLVGKEKDSGELVENAMPCSMCKRMIINAGIETVYIRDDKENYRVYKVDSWIEDDDSLGLKDNY